MELFRIIKADAKRALHFCGGRTVASFLVVALVLLTFGIAETTLHLIFSGEEILYYDLLTLFKKFPESVFVTAGITFLRLFTLPALLLGLVKLFLSFAEGNDESISMIFYMFSSFKKFIGSAFFAISFALRYAFVFAVALLPGTAFFWFSKSYIPEGTRSLGLLKLTTIFIAICIMTLCVFLAIIFIQRWSLAPYYRAYGKSIHKSFSLSAKATKGLYTNILSFKVSFIWWGFLSVLILPLLWSVPYYCISNAIYAKYLMERYERSLAEVPESVSPEFTFQETD